MRHGRVLIVVIGRSWFVNVRFRALSGLKSDIAPRPSCARSRHSALAFDHLVGAGAKVEASQPTGGFTGNQQNASLPTVPRVHSANVSSHFALKLYSYEVKPVALPP